MGRKCKVSSTDPLRGENSAIPAYFQATDKKEKGTGKQQGAAKMARVTQQESQLMETEGITKSDFIQLIKKIDDLEGGLRDKFNGLLKPLTESMEKLAANLQQVSKIAEDTKAITLSQQSVTTFAIMMKNSRSNWPFSITDHVF